MINTTTVREALKKSGVGLDFDTLPEHESFQSHGLDSMDMMNVFLEIEEAFGLKIPDDDIAQLDSIQSIINYLQEKS